jgi:hypothetical protein
MDGTRFDAWLHGLTTARSRRGALRMLLGGVVGGAGVQQARAGFGGPCVPACPECTTCQKGLCHRKKRHGKLGKKHCLPGQCLPIFGDACEGNECKFCQDGACVNKADTMACQNGAGVCRSGICTPPV